MQGRWRRLLDAVGRILSFVAAHPIPNPKHAGAVTELAQLHTRLRGLVVRQGGGQVDSRAAREHRRNLRRGISDRFFKLIVGVAKRASRDLPEVFGSFRVPPSKASYEAFIGAATGMLEVSKAHAEALSARGLGDDVIGELEKAVAELERLTKVANQARGQHRTATTEFRSLTAEAGELIGVLDGVYRYHFPGDVHLLTAWASARALGTPHTRPETPPHQGGVTSAP